MVVAYRNANYFNPLWADPSPFEGRFHRAGQTAQYLCLHPLGPAAEALRHAVGPVPEDFDDLRLNLWAIQIADEGIVNVNFADCQRLGITPDQLVADEYAATQGLADRLRDQNVFALRVPSAALPGTDNLVLFGPRVSCPYLEFPVQPEELPTGHLSDDARSPGELIHLVRWIGTPHSALRTWETTGVYQQLVDPVPVRW